MDHHHGAGELGTLGFVDGERIGELQVLKVGRTLFHLHRHAVDNLAMKLCQDVVNESSPCAEVGLHIDRRKRADSQHLRDKKCERAIGVAFELGGAEFVLGRITAPDPLEIVRVLQKPFVIGEAGGLEEVVGVTPRGS